MPASQNRVCDAVFISEHGVFSSFFEICISKNFSFNKLPNIFYCRSPPLIFSDVLLSKAVVCCINVSVFVSKKAVEIAYIVCVEFLKDTYVP